MRPTSAGGILVWRVLGTRHPPVSAPLIGKRSQRNVSAPSRQTEESAVVRRGKCLRRARGPVVAPTAKAICLGVGVCSCVKS
jgi:hypothetical protein